MIQHFTVHTINCVCHSIKSMFRVLDIYNFACTLGFARGIYTDEYEGRDRDAVSAS